MHSPLTHLFTSWPWTSLDLANHLWQSTVVGLAVLALLTACGRLSAGTRRTLGWMALAKFALPIAWIASLIKGAGGTPEKWLVSNHLAFPVKLSSAMFTSAAPAPTLTTAGLLLVAGWLAGFGALFALWLAHGFQLRRGILARAREVTAALERPIAAAAERAGLRQPPRCLATKSDCGPGVLGVFSPVVILPRGLEDSLTPAELESVLIHEFLHLKRRDNLWSVVQALLVCLLWFNPVVWLLHRRLSAETEKSCDERVLEITGDPDNYAGGIFKSVRHALGIAQPRFAGMATPPMVDRIKNILAHDARPDRPLARGAALAAGALLLALSGHAGSIAPSVSPAPAPSAPAAVPFAAAPKAAPLTTDDATPPAPTPQPPPEPAAAPSPAPASNPANGGGRGLGIQIFDQSQLDQQPIPTTQRSPTYPYEMRRAGISGEVVVDFIVDDAGRVLNPFAAKSSKPEFESAAVLAVSKWRFKPGRKNHRAVYTHMQVPIVFTLNNNE